MNRKATAVGITAVLLVAVVYVLAGGGTNLTDQSEPTNQSDLTDTNEEPREKSDEERIQQFVPEESSPEEPTQTPSFYPAGIDGSGNINTQTVIANHVSVVERNSVTTQISKQTGESAQNRTYRKTGSRILNRVDTSDSVRLVYSDGERLYEYIDNSEYAIRNGSISVSELANAGFFEPVLAMTQTARVTTTQDSDKTIEVRRTTDRDAIAGNAQLIGYSSINNITATFHIREDGLITSADVSVSGIQFGAQRTETLQYDTRGLGQTAVNRPQWISDAKESKTLVEAELTQRGWIAVEHKGLASVDENAQITITNQSGQDETFRLPQTFSEGDTLYAYKTVDGWVPQINTQPPRSSLNTDSVFIVSGTERRELFRTPAS